MKKVGNFEYDPQVIEKLCKENNISYLALFGSYLYGDNTPKSDLDLLVKFTDTQGMGLLRYVGIQNKFSDTLNKKVDLVMADGIDPYIKDRVLNEAKVIYKNE